MLTVTLEHAEAFLEQIAQTDSDADLQPGVQHARCHRRKNHGGLASVPGEADVCAESGWQWVAAHSSKRYAREIYAE